MTTQDYLRVVRERWLVVVVAVLVGLAGSAAAFLIRPAEYTARLTMYVSAQGGDSPSAAFQAAQLSQDRVKSYTELVSNTRVSADVITRLRLDETPDALSKQITATSALDSVIIDVAVTDLSPVRAAQLANTVGQVFTDLVAELERPIQVGGQPAVAVRVVQPAAEPMAASSAGLLVTLLLGLILGVVVGIASALTRNSLDTSIKSLDQLRDAVQVPNLGVIAYDPEVPKRPLTVHEEPNSPRSEAFRQLRTNLQFVDVDSPRKVIAVTSALPDEGKTTTVVNLAIAIASTGSRVLVIEADLRQPKLADLLGVERTVGLTSVLSERLRIEQAIQPWGGEIFDVLASGPLPPNPSELLASQHMKSLLTELRTQYDVVLVDTPPLLPVTDAAAVAPAVDGVILVCRFKQTTVTQVTAATEALTSVSAHLLGTVFTMVPGAGPGAYARYNSYYRSESTSPAAPDRRAESTTATTSDGGRVRPIFPSATPPGEDGEQRFSSEDERQSSPQPARGPN